MSIVKDLQELVEKGIISEDTASDIRAYYKEDNSSKSQRLLTVFSIIGAALIGLGIILLIAHNWDNFSRPFKTFLSFIPVVTGQALCVYTYFRNKDWQEGAAIFLGLAIGACITLIAQIYNIPGNENEFFFTWTILTLPLVFLLRSRIVSILCLILAGAFSLAPDYRNEGFPIFFYWIFYFCIVVFYLQEIEKDRKSFFNRSFIWLLALAPLISLNQFTDSHTEILFVNYFLVFNLYFILSEHSIITQKISNTTPLKVIGLIGMNFIFILLTFNRPWEALRRNDTFFFNQEIFILIILLTSTFVYYYKNENRSHFLSGYNFLKIPFIIFFFSGYFSDVGYFLMNIMTLLISIYTIQQGLKSESLRITNIGLLTLGALILCRFFDNEYSFIARGIVFIIVGTGFLLTNFAILKKRSSNAA